MVREIVRDRVFLSMKSDTADEKDLPAAQDLLDTLRAHADGCIGMAGNMIGVRKCMLAVGQPFPQLMLNPEIVQCSGPYEAEEGCLSLDGTRRVLRFRTVEVRYQDIRWQWHRKTYSGIIAEAIQHEIDHMKGILI